MEDYDRIMKYGKEEEKNEIKDKMKIGVFQNIQKPGFFEQYEDLVERLAAKESKTIGGKK